MFDVKIYPSRYSIRPYPNCGRNAIYHKVVVRRRGKKMCYWARYKC